eukprot:4388462-Heterocapsa_arctica.AAC.1
MRPPLLVRPPVRQGDLVAQALGAAPVPVRPHGGPKAQPLMAKPGVITKACSTTPKPVNVQRRWGGSPQNEMLVPPAAPGPNLGQPDRHTLRTWRLNDYDWVRFSGGVGYDL